MTSFQYCFSTKEITKGIFLIQPLFPLIVYCAKGVIPSAVIICLLISSKTTPLVWTLTDSLLCVVQQSCFIDTLLCITASDGFFSSSFFYAIALIASECPEGMRACVRAWVSVFLSYGKALQMILLTWFKNLQDMLYLELRWWKTHRAFIFIKQERIPTTAVLSISAFSVPLRDHSL